MVILLIAVVVLFAGLARFMARANGIPGSRSAGTLVRRRPEDAGTPAGGVLAADREVEQQATWTALDEIQLNRLLKESS